MQSGQLDPALKRLTGVIRRHTCDCVHCAVYAGYGANQVRVRAERIGAVFELETSPLFGAEERAVLVGSHGALPASAVTDDDISALSPHFTRQEVVKIVAVLSLAVWFSQSGAAYSVRG